MTSCFPAGFSAHRKSLALIAFITIAITVLVLWFQLRDECAEVCARVEFAATLTQDKFETHHRSRPVLWGKAAPGNAFDLYLEALSKIKSLADRVDLLAPDDESYSPIETWLRQGGELPKPVLDLLDELMPVLNQLREGAHREAAHHRVDWEDELLNDQQTWWDLATFVLLYQLHTQQVLKAGDHIEAVRLMLDALQLARDLLQSVSPLTVLHGCAAARPALSALVTEVNAHELEGEEHRPHVRVPLSSFDADALTLLAEGLAKADQPLTSIGDLIRGSALLFLRASQKELRTAGSEHFLLDAGLEFGFSAEWMLSDAVEREMQIADALDAVEQTWPELRVIASAHTERLERDESNMFWRMCSSNIEDLESFRREFLVRIRALRMAVAKARGDELVLPDPFGPTALQVVEAGKTAKYWSVGADGIDNHGDPDFDVVFEVSR